MFRDYNLLIMTIKLEKFGTLLFSREAGREAFAALQSQLTELKEDVLELDFSGVITFSPSWGDEFLTALIKKYGQKVFLIHTGTNPTVKATLEILTQINKTQFQIKS